MNREFNVPGIPRRTIGKIAAGLAISALALTMSGAAFAQERVKIEWWHALGGRLTEIVDTLVVDFNKSQDKYEVVAINKGNYEETMAAMVAAFRVGEQPQIIQTPERTFSTMLNSGAVVPASDLMTAQGYTIDWDDFVAPVAGFYLSGGKPAAMPFNSSTPIFWYNADHFKAAGFDGPADTWQGVEKQLYAIHEKGISKCSMALAYDFVWSMIENYSAIHDVEYGTKSNGFDGLDSEFTFNKSPLVLGQLTRMSKWINDGVMQIAGQGLSPDQLFVSGDCSTYVASTALHAAVESGAKFNWSATFLPHEEGYEPKNSTIGGAALWVLKGNTPEEDAGVAAFLNFVALPKTQVWWSETTGYVPITKAAYANMKAEGFFDKHPTREIAIQQLSRGTPTVNSRGFRFGNHSQIFVLMNEEIQGVWTGKKTPQEALDSSVTRGNQVLRQYEALNGGK